MVCSAIMHSTDEIFCSLHVRRSVAAGISEKGVGGGWHESIHIAVARGSLPSLITIQLAYLCESAHRGRACCRVHRAVPLPYVQPSFDPSAQHCPFGDLACFIMQITLHLPDRPCACMNVCVYVCEAGASGENRKKI